MNWSWFIESLIMIIICFVPEWISVFAQIGWMNDSLTHNRSKRMIYLLTQPLFISERISVFAQIGWMNDSLIHLKW